MEALRSVFRPREPPASVDPFSTVAGGHHYTWRGWGPGREATTIGMYNPHTEQWSLRPTTGSTPPAECDGGCTAVGNQLYTFGGVRSETDFNDLYKLDLGSDPFQWSKVEPKNDSSEWPLCKQGCGLVSVDEGSLLGCFGGYSLGPTQPRSTFTMNTIFNNRDGWTNEFHLFNLQEGVWSTPDIKGQRPPCSHFSFTKIDRHRAVLFGGAQSGWVKVHDVYVFNFRTMEVTKVEPVQGEPWPVGRVVHAACCLNYGEDHPKLLVSGGLDTGDKVLGDMWILDVDAGRWTEVTPPESVKPRWRHSITATSLVPGLTEVLMFGGRLTVLGDPIAETTVLRFESTAPSPSVAGLSTEKWALVDVAHNNTRGSRQRLREKNAKIRHCASSVREPTDQPLGDRVRSLEQQLRAAEERERDGERRAAEATRREQATQHRLQESLRQVEEANRRSEDAERRSSNSERRLREAQQTSQEAEQRAVEAERMIQELTAEIGRLQGDLQEMERRAQQAEQRVDNLETQWVVHRREIQMTERELGKGGWGAVKVAKFRGIEVAAKALYEQIRSDYYRHLFIREMNMAARLRHPNLVQFIGATLDRDMIILTELMHTSLRRVLEQRSISREHIISISVQVCQALNYLHLMQPDPVIHRDISSANVLLNPLPNNHWRAKVTDYGSVNTLRALQTENPGNPVYAAPEARTPSLQSTKMDIFSVGVLLIEMCTGQFPSDDGRERLLYTIQDRQFKGIIRRCIDREKDNRPTALELLGELV